MNSYVRKQIIRFMILLVLQVLLFNHVHLFGFINPNVYLYALLMLPLSLPRSAQFAIAFATGFIVDIFQMTYGIHASACMFFILIRPYIINSLNVSKKKNENELPIPGKKDLKWLFIYIFILVFVHQFLFTMLEVFSLKRFGYVLLMMLVNALFTTLLILSIEYIFIPKKNKHN